MKDRPSSQHIIKKIRERIQFVSSRAHSVVSIGIAALSHMSKGASTAGRGTSIGYRVLIAALIGALAASSVSVSASAQQSSGTEEGAVSSDLADIIEMAQLQAEGDADTFASILGEYGAIDVTKTIAPEFSSNASAQQSNLPSDIFEVDFQVLEMQNYSNAPILIMFGAWDYRDNWGGAYGPHNTSAIQFEGFPLSNADDQPCWGFDISNSTMHTWDYQGNLTSGGDDPLVRTYVNLFTTEGVIHNYEDGASLDIGLFADHGSHVTTMTGYADIASQTPRQGCGYDDGSPDAVYLNYHHSHHQDPGRLGVSFSTGGWGLDLNILQGNPSYLTKSSSIVSPQTCEEWEGDLPDLCEI